VATPPHASPSSGEFVVGLALLQVNQKAQHVDYNRFYISDVTALVDIQQDYLKWFLSKETVRSLEKGPL